MGKGGKEVVLNGLSTSCSCREFIKTSAPHFGHSGNLHQPSHPITFLHFSARLLLFTSSLHLLLFTLSFVRSSLFSLSFSPYLPPLPTPLPHPYSASLYLTYPILLRRPAPILGLPGIRFGSSSSLYLPTLIRYTFLIFL